MRDDDGSDGNEYEYNDDEDMADDDEDDYSEDYVFDDDDTTCDCDDVVELTWSGPNNAGDDDDNGKKDEQSYVVLTEDAVRARQETETAKVAEILSIPRGFAALLLRHFKWRAGRVQEKWFADDGRSARTAVGLPPADADLLPTTVSRAAEQLCAICFASYPGGQTRSAGCGAHFYCADCWRAYIRAAVDDGAARCLSLRCPDPSCPAAVARELVDAAADSADRDRYARLALRSFLEAGSAGGGRIKWCPGAGCTRAVEMVLDDGGGSDAAAADVLCECGHGFCWRCGEEAHRPVSCDTVRAWLDKNASYTETSNWMLADTKHCPRCRLPIEKNQGCMHMTCPPPCGHQFCWVCLDPWDNHRGCEGFQQQLLQGEDQDGADDDAGAGVEDDGDVGQEEAERRARQEAHADMDRYVYHYERWAANYSSLESVFKDMAELESSGIAAIAAVAGQPEASFAFLVKAYEEIARGRRVLKWSYAYGYYLLDPDHGGAGAGACRVKRGLFEDLLDQANSWLERLHDAAEPAVVRDLLTYYKGKVESYTAATGTLMRNLVKAFETTDLPEFKSLKN